MTDYADADLVSAIVKDRDHLKLRAEHHLRHHSVRVPFSVGIELLFIAPKMGLRYRDFVGAATQHFEVERSKVLLTAAEALDEGEVKTVFDAVHAAQALADGVRLVTTDQKLLKSAFPTAAF